MVSLIDLMGDGSRQESLAASGSFGDARHGKEAVNSPAEMPQILTSWDVGVSIAVGH